MNNEVNDRKRRDTGMSVGAGQGEEPNSRKTEPRVDHLSLTFSVIQSHV